MFYYRVPMNRRVVITGMGAVSPNGVGNDAFAKSTLAGTSGVHRISRFDPSEISVQIAGEVPEFDELAWVEKRERKHVGRVLPLALAAATEALNTAGIDCTSLPLEQRRRFAQGFPGGSSPWSKQPPQARPEAPASDSESAVYRLHSGTAGPVRQTGTRPRRMTDNRLT
jgi:3-oxoacyl-[acyl-carrier-protein] synthase II